MGQVQPQPAGPVGDLGGMLNSWDRIVAGRTWACLAEANVIPARVRLYATVHTRWPKNVGSIEHPGLKFLRTLCGLRGPTPSLTCTNALIHTLKRNSTTSPSLIT